MNITVEQIRKELRRWDRWYRAVKPSKTIALLDPIYHRMSEVQLKDYVHNARTTVFSRIEYTPDKADCENITNWCISKLQMQWAQMGNSRYEPAVFRIIINGKPLHAIAIAFIEEGIRFIEFQTYEIWGEENAPDILALT